jgi:MSHA biogenesis protein MshP
MSRPLPASKQHGFAAVAAIFLVVLLAALGSFMLSFSNTQQLSSAQDVEGSRAYWAARGGLEWALAGIAGSMPTPPATTPAPACPATAAPTTVEGFNMAISCGLTSYNEGGVAHLIFRITSVASKGSVGTSTYIERSVSASLEWSESP